VHVAEQVGGAADMPAVSSERPGTTWGLVS
jgi:hypothetical protein